MYAQEIGKAIYLKALREKIFLPKHAFLFDAKL